MLEYIREKMQSTFATVIVGLFCAAFVLWGVERVFTGGSKKQAVATVNGTEISEPELARAIQNMRQRYAQMFGGKVDASFLNDKMLREPALNSLISRQLLEDQALAMKMTAGAETVDKVIVSNPMFSKDGKTFDPDFYKEQLRSAGVTAADYQRQLRQQLTMDHLQKGVSATAFVTTRQVADIARLETQERSFEYIRLPLQDAMKGISPTDEAVAAYYNDHQDQFLTEEKVAIEYIELSKENLLKDIKVDEADIRAAYDQEMASFKPVTERHAAHILIDAKADGSDKVVLETISKRLKAGDNFAALAKQYSRDEGSANQGGDVGFTTGETFVPDFEKALAALKNPGDISEPVKTEFGYHIIKLLEVRQTKAPTYDERKADIGQKLRQNQVGNIYTEKLDKLSESTYSAGDLAGPAAELGLSLQKSAPFGRRGGPGIAAQQKIIDAAFSGELLDSGKNSQVIELSADKAVVLRVASHDLPKTRELAQVRSEIIESLKHEQAVVALKAKLDALKARLEAGESIQALAAAEKLPVVAVKDKQRNAGGDEAGMLQAVFKLPHPAGNAVVTGTAQLDNGDWVLLHLTAIKEGQQDAGSEAYKNVQQRLASAASSVEFSLYQEHLREKADITRRDAPPVDSQGDGQ